ncbi:MAG TPA: FAD-binding oxidoreductase [Falsiroseomonas sp.]|jgi:4-cresol dehydrogenase (hydroxylating)|nr:FAD-binding oxidoreductase [Falsiroseomonas sp.]
MSGLQNSVSSAFLAEAEAELGTEGITTEDAVRAEYGAHSLPVPDAPPAAVLFPASTAQVQGIVALANRHRAPLFPVSTGWNLGLGTRAPMAPGQVVVDLSRRMNRIIEVEEDLGYCVVEPGVTFEAMYAELERRGSRLMMSPTAGPPLGGLLGNALDKGGGAGPNGNHFDNVCGMEVVLGNGDIIRTGDGGLDAPEHPNWHVTKYSFGPALDGLFTQSNFGIVTRIGMWLAERPKRIRCFFFTYEAEEDFAEILDLIRPLKASGAVPTMFRATSDLYLLASQEPSPDYAASGGARPIAEAARRALRHWHGVGAWTVSGAVYGASDAAVEASLERVLTHFMRSGRARYLPQEEAEGMPVLRAAIDSLSGRPAGGELQMLRWRPGGGAIWFTPGVPMRGREAQATSSACRDVAASLGIDYMASFVCGPRFARGVHAILYNRNDPEEAERADACYRAMSDIFRERGIFVGRAPTAYQVWHHEQRDPAVQRTVSAIKQALDPNGVIAPGRYGIA